MTLSYTKDRGVFWNLPSGGFLFNFLLEQMRPTVAVLHSSNYQLKRPKKKARKGLKSRMGLLGGLPILLKSRNSIMKDKFWPPEGAGFVPWILILLILGFIIIKLINPSL